jgi:hypothetical protein
MPNSSISLILLIEPVTELSLPHRLQHRAEHEHVCLSEMAPSRHSMNSLPIELVTCIALTLTAKDALSLSRTRKRYLYLLTEDVVWEAITSRDYPTMKYISPSVTNYKTLSSFSHVFSIGVCANRHGEDSFLMKWLMKTYSALPTVVPIVYRLLNDYAVCYKSTLPARLPHSNVFLFLSPTQLVFIANKERILAEITNYPTTEVSHNHEVVMEETAPKLYLHWHDKVQGCRSDLSTNEKMRRVSEVCIMLFNNSE